MNMTTDIHQFAKQNPMEVIINGVRLNEGQCLTLHVALGAYAIEMSSEENPYPLGDDAHGKIMQEAYLNRLREIMALYI